MIFHLEEVTCLLAGRIRLWHQILALTSFSRHPLNLTLVFWTDKASGLIQSSWGQRWCHVVLKGSSSWSTTRKKKSSSLNSVHSQGVLRKRLFLRAAWATLCAGKRSFDFIFPMHSQAIGRTGIQKDFWLLFPHQATKIPALFHSQIFKDREIKVSRVLG